MNGTAATRIINSLGSPQVKMTSPRYRPHNMHNRGTLHLTKRLPHSSSQTPFCPTIQCERMTKCKIKGTKTDCSHCRQNLRSRKGRPNLSQCNPSDHIATQSKKYLDQVATIEKKVPCTSQNKTTRQPSKTSLINCNLAPRKPSKSVQQMMKEWQLLVDKITADLL